MGLFRRRDDEVVDESTERVVKPSDVERTEVVSYRWTPGSVLAVIGGAALVVIGIVALTRTELNSTWYRPVEQVAGFDHTPLLAAVEIGVGAVVVLLALAGARLLTALVCVVAAIGAAIAAIDPETFSEELAIERSWAVGLAAVAAAIALLLLPPWPTTVERREGARVTRRTFRRPAQQP